MNRLTDFPSQQTIFVDANIWAYFALNTEPFQAACATFLYRVETGQISAVTSNMVLNETFYAVLVGKAAAELQINKIEQIHRHLLQDTNLAAVCYQACLNFTDYLNKLNQARLQILTVDYQIQVTALELGSRYGLLPTDALHVATCQHFKIAHIATADAHFERVSFLRVWQPTP